MRELRGRNLVRSLGGVAAASVLALVAAAPTASAQSVPKSVKAIGSAAFAITREDTMSIDYLDAIGPPGRTPIIGDFVGDDSPTGNLDDILWYTPGPGGDAMWETVGDRSWKARPISIAGTFTPLVGNFTSDGKTDVFWYAPGSAADSLWDFNPNGTISSVTGNSVSGTYTPIVGRFSADGGDDIIWYAPGATRDVWWDYNGSGGRTDRGLTINGSFKPVVGSFAGSGSPTFDQVEDILWYAPGSGADSLWDFNQDGGTAAIVKTSLSISGTYTPVAGDFSHDGFTDVIWYAPGTAKDSMWNFTNATGGHSSVPLTINGSYTPITGEIFEQGAHQTDILWFGTGSKADSLWDFDFGTGHTSRPVSLSGNRKPSLARLELTPTDCCTTSGLDIIDHTL